MAEENLHQQLQQVSKQIDKAEEAVRLSQGTDFQLVQQAKQQLKHAEQNLQNAQDQSGTEATENPQFQQAFEQIHNTRQHIQEVEQHSDDV
ncbi:hypothetical protein SAMN05421676_1139 [Salinibacillus kushneri]|uniref:DUF2564 family protein n=1 Tax=Salinibacillus kushneri TaxID=237682 RepID=A0A1I0IDV8_9BACI|nr:hypothetical protein [Salinibacillus kushneri]SET94124.1 hypothetical protein SAMN05421676_11199 [Salinibacillus kushneri]SET97978.1 hypothetical protein SAMN05421676_1139 [Salinibacillus kushneri]